MSLQPYLTASINSAGFIKRKKILKEGKKMAVSCSSYNTNFIQLFSACYGRHRRLQSLANAAMCPRFEKMVHRIYSAIISTNLLPAILNFARTRRLWNTLQIPTNRGVFCDATHLIFVFAILFPL